MINLSKVAETGTTVTLGWAPVSGVTAYRFSSELQAKPSHTWDATRDRVKFAKGSSWYRVEALDVLDVGRYPLTDVFPDPARYPSEVM